MKVISIISEYNPFHLGHAYQLQQLKEKWGKNVATLIVMSGSFTQRGEPAILSKWDRARCALKSGADLIIELPAVFACSSAETFARGSVKLIESTGISKDIFFGTETGSLDHLNELAKLLNQEPEAYKQSLTSYLKEGFHFAKARLLAIKPFLDASLDFEALQTLTKQSNTILALEYLKAAHYWKIENKLNFHTLKREGQNYNDTLDSVNDGFWSATAIRELCYKHRHQPSAIFSNLRTLVPSYTLACLTQASRSNSDDPLAFLEDTFPVLMAQLLLATQDDLNQTPGFEGGLSNRIVSILEKKRAHIQSVQELINLSCSKTFSKTRIQRAFMAFLLKLSLSDYETARSSGPQYCRILGFTKKGQYLLKIMKKQSTLPILLNNSDLFNYKTANPSLYSQGKYDLYADDLRSLFAKQSPGKYFEKKPILW